MPDKKKRQALQLYTMYQSRKLSSSICCATVNGITTIEVVVALAVSMPLLTLFATGFHHSVYTYHKVTKTYRNYQTYLRTKDLFEQVMYDLDSHPFKLLPKIHQNGAIKFSDGTLNQLHRTPNKKSDAITILRLDMLASHQVTEAKSGQLTACARYEHNFSPQEYKGYLGIHANGFTELVGEVSNTNSLCKEFLLVSTKSMMVPPTSGNVLAIIPITQHYTLYVDNKHQLRYLSHEGANNIENQPIVKNIKKLSLGYTMINSIVELKGIIEFKDGKQKSFTVFNRIGRGEHYNALLNRS